MKRVIRAATLKSSKSNFISAMKLVIDSYYALPQNEMEDIDDTIGEDFIFELEDAYKALKM